MGLSSKTSTVISSEGAEASTRPFAACPFGWAMGSCAEVRMFVATHACPQLRVGGMRHLLARRDLGLLLDPN